jgi:two-component sensor histidine kinase
MLPASHYKQNSLGYFISRRRYWGLYLLVWALLVSFSFWWTVHSEKAHLQEISYDRAQSLFSFVQTIRHWNASMGGVYVPVSDSVTPNPYLKDPLRDVETIDGLKLTKINPAYMTRQLAELSNFQGGLLFHITSLKPIRPENKPDPWEKRALELFENGELEVMTSEGDFRYMAPLVTNAVCLKCHAVQGYKLGDIRGGISITFSQSSIEEMINPRLRKAFKFHLSIFIVISAGILFFLNYIRKQWFLLENMTMNLEKIVETRTSELEKNNQSLEFEIHENEKAKEQISAALKEKEVLLQEIHHRVKNNMQIIVSLLKMQARKTEDKEFKKLYKESESRIQTMMMIHEKLYGSQNLSHIDFKDYVDELMMALSHSYSAEAKHINREVDIENVFLSIDQAIPCGLIINELVTNSYKYAFEGKEEGCIKISVTEDSSGLQLAVEDDGVGFPEGYNIELSETLGCRLIAILVENQLKGTYSWTSGNGLRFVMNFVQVKDSNES